MDHPERSDPAASGDLDPPAKSDESLAGILSVAEDGIVSVDGEHRIRFFNRGAERIFGYEAAEVLGRPLEVLLPDRFRGGHAGHMAEFARSGQTARMMNERGQVAGLRKSGEEFPAEVSISKLDVGAETIFTAILRDVTERSALEAQLRQAQKLDAIGRLAGGIAHDFNNLLTVIGGYAGMLLRRLELGDPRWEDANQIKRACDRAAGLTAQMLALSRRRMLAPRVADLNEIVRDTQRMLRHAVGEHVRMVTKLDPKLGSVTIDAGQFEQVLTNLAINARDAMPEGGTLIVETANVEVDAEYAALRLGLEPGRYVALSVSDTGHGMDAETKAHVFEPFFTTKQETKGTGLGLSIVYGIVKQCGGHIWVYSEVGKGTTFRILLPRAEEAPPPRPDVVPVESTRGSATVLLVEDEAEVRRLTRRMLEDAGYAVLEAGSGPEALALEERHVGPIHLLLTDVVMPLMTGPALAERVVVARPATRVLFMSGYTKDATLHNKTLGEKVAFLGKPFTSDDLLRAVRAALES
jgi:PAS domain S-box-containing protein